MAQDVWRKKTLLNPRATKPEKQKNPVAGKNKKQ